MAIILKKATWKQWHVSVSCSLPSLCLCLHLSIKEKWQSSLFVLWHQCLAQAPPYYLIIIMAWASIRQTWKWKMKKKKERKRWKAAAAGENNIVMKSGMAKSARRGAAAWHQARSARAWRKAWSAYGICSRHRGMAWWKRHEKRVKNEEDGNGVAIWKGSIAAKIARRR